MSNFFKASFTLGALLGLSYTQQVECTDWEKYVPDFAKQYIPSKSKDGSTFYGPMNMKDATLNHDLEVMGPLTLNHTDIKGETTAYGPFSGQDLNLNSLTVYGPAEVKNTHVGELEIYGPLTIMASDVSGHTDIKGPIHSKDTVFQKDISVASTIATFEDSKLQNIEIQPPHEIGNKSSVVYLKGKTIVEGNITFASGAGKVIADKSVQIKGTIKGGVKE